MSTRTRHRRVGGAEKSAAAAVPGERLVDIPEAISLLKTSRPTFYRWLRTGKFKGMKVGRQWRFRRALLDEYLDTLASESVGTGGAAPRFLPSLPASTRRRCP